MRAIVNATMGFWLTQSDDRNLRGPAVTLRVYSHVLREHAVSVGDIFARAVKGSR
jgi:hypothetical protein